MNRVRTPKHPKELNLQRFLCEIGVLCGVKREILRVRIETLEHTPLQLERGATRRLPQLRQTYGEIRYPIGRHSLVFVLRRANSVTR